MWVAHLNREGRWWPRRYAVAQLLVGLIAVLTIPLPDIEHVPMYAGVTAAGQLARGQRRLKDLDSDPDIHTFAPEPRPAGTGKQPKSPSGGYEPPRIQRFWRQYHGARPEPKSKPLERVH